MHCQELSRLADQRNIHERIGFLENQICRSPTAIKKKIAKRYGSSSWLVVYLNLSEYGIRQHETVRVIVALKYRYADAFERLLMLWKDKLY